MPTTQHRYRTYKRHYCDHRHRSWQTLGKCLWPHAHTVAGEGPWATTTSCRYGTVSSVYFYETREGAEAALDFIDRHHCGGKCVGAHGLFFLGDMHLIEPEMVGRLRFGREFDQ